MKRNDWIAVSCYLILFAATYVLISNGILASFNINHPYWAGFWQFFIYATGGEFLSTRIITTHWKMDGTFIYKALIWGIGGMIITLNFRMFFVGTADAMNIGLLPFKGNRIAHAFYTSSANNLMYGPIHAAFTVIAGCFLELRVVKHQQVTVYDTINHIDWSQFVNFVLFKCIPFFWIPVNTWTFLLPSEYRVICAAILSLVFGLLMTLLKLHQKKVFAA